MKARYFALLGLFLFIAPFSVASFFCPFDNSFECNSINPSVRQGNLSFPTGTSLLVAQGTGSSYPILGYSATVISKERGTIQLKLKPVGWNKNDSGQKMIFHTETSAGQISLRYYGRMSRPAPFLYYLPNDPDNKLAFIIGAFRLDPPNNDFQLTFVYADVADWFNPDGTVIEKFYDVVVTWDNPADEIAIYIDGKLKGSGMDSFDFNPGDFTQFYVGTDREERGVPSLNAYIDDFGIYSDVRHAVPRNNCENGFDNHYQNPFYDIDTGDTTVIKHDGTYYLYGNSFADWMSSPVNGPITLSVWTSTDLKNWTKGGPIMDPTTYYGVNQYEAGAVEYNGNFYFFYSAEVPTIAGNPSFGRDCGRAGFTRRNALAVSSFPIGPFRTIVAPLTPPLATDIPCEVEVQIFIDDDRKIYLYSTEVMEDLNPGPPIQPVNVVSVYELEELTPSGATFELGSRRVLLRPNQSWEFFGWLGGNPCTECGIVEGADVIKVDGVYYLVYSGNYATLPTYSLGYATSNSPLGPFTKASGNPFITYNYAKGAFGPGNGSFAKGLDNQEMLYFYHSKINVGENAYRVLNFDRLQFDSANRRITTNAPTRTPQKINPQIACINNAACGEVGIPDAMLVGETLSVFVDLFNSGNTTWDSTLPSNPYRLGSQEPQDNTRWGTNRIDKVCNVNLANCTLSNLVDLKQQNHVPDSLGWYRFYFSITAPTTPDTYPAKWRMVQDGREWFGAICGKNVRVILPASCPDAKRNGTIDIFDLVMFVKAINENNTAYDITNDNPPAINIADLQATAQKIGTNCTI